MVSVHCVLFMCFPVVVMFGSVAGAAFGVVRALEFSADFRFLGGGLAFGGTVAAVVAGFL